MKFFLPSRAKIVWFIALTSFMFLGFGLMGVALEGWMAPPAHPSELYLLTEKYPSLSAAIGMPLLTIYSYLALPLLPIIFALKQHAVNCQYYLFPIYCYLLACLIVWVLTQKTIPQAGYTAIVYAVISTRSIGLAWFHASSTRSLAIVLRALIIGLLFGALAFGIFRRSRVAIILMLVSVVGLQPYTWFVMHSPSGSLLSIIVTAFLLRGARRIFQDDAERETEAETV
jgi:hypothetical protein